MSFSLYEMNYNIEKCLDTAFDIETGEILDEQAMADFEALVGQREQRFEYVALKILSANAEIDALKAEEARLKARRESIVKKQERMKKYILDNLQKECDPKTGEILSIEQIKTTKVTIGTRKSKTVVIDAGVNIEELPEELRIKEVSYKADKKAIQKYLEVDDHRLEGCYVSKNISLQVK